MKNVPLHSSVFLERFVLTYVFFVAYFSLYHWVASWLEFMLRQKYPSGIKGRGNILASCIMQCQYGMLAFKVSFIFLHVIYVFMSDLVI